jgi:hypothetical protein
MKGLTTREIALRCAAAMDHRLLFHRWPKNENARTRYAIPDRIYKNHGIALLRQLDACKDDEARRLLMGRSR